MIMELTFGLLSEAIFQFPSYEGTEFFIPKSLVDGARKILIQLEMAGFRPPQVIPHAGDTLVFGWGTLENRLYIVLRSDDRDPFVLTMTIPDELEELSQLRRELDNRAIPRSRGRVGEDGAMSNDSDNKRWLVTVTYLTDEGPTDVVHHVEELIDVHALVENGPDWNAIDGIRIILNPARRHPVTVQEARSL